MILQTCPFVSRLGMLLQVFLFTEVNGQAHATCDVRMISVVRSPFSPAQPCACRDLRFALAAMARRSVRSSVQTSSRTEQVCGAKHDGIMRLSPSLKPELTIHLLLSGVCVRRARGDRKRALKKWYAALERLRGNVVLVWNSGYPLPNAVRDGGLIRSTFYSRVMP